MSLFILTIHYSSQKGKAYRRNGTNLLLPNNLIAVDYFSRHDKESQATSNIRFQFKWQQLVLKNYKERNDKKPVLNKWQREDYFNVSKIVHIVIVTYKASKFLTNKQEKGASLHEIWSTTYVTPWEFREIIKSSTLVAKTLLKMQME